MSELLNNPKARDGDCRPFNPDNLLPAESSLAAPAGSVNAWLDKELGQIGIDMRQSGYHKSMLIYLQKLREEIEMTERFLREDGYSPNEKGQQ